MRQRAGRLYSVDGLARETMLLTAEPRLKPVGTLPAARVEVGEHWQGLDPLRRPIWEYETVGLDQVRNVSVRQAALKGAAVTVCERIAWGAVSIATKRGGSYELPLSADFLLKTYFLDDGEIPELAAGLWQLPTNLHNSFQRMFGYQVDLATGKLYPLPRKALDNPELLYPSDEGFTPQTVNNGDVIVRVPLRVLVCITLGCATERCDFEPSGALGAARLYPMTQILSNRDLERAEAEIVVQRPSQSARCHIDGEQMTPALGSAFFTDRNVHLRLPIPTWDNFFDYYSSSIAVGDRVVAVQAGKAQGTHPDAVEVLTGGDPYRGDEYRPRSIYKVERQGEFDNVHIAPKMIAPAEVVARNPGMAATLQAITMAPICIHDCLHTHWRWGLDSSKKGLLGWSGTADDIGEPNQVVAAPMVPPNQDVIVTPLSPSSFRYTAKIKRPRAGVWQPVNHHGSAYAVSIGFWLGSGPVRALQTTNADFLGDRLRGSWAAFYWMLRYRPGASRAIERIRLTDDKVRQLRAL